MEAVFPAAGSSVYDNRRKKTNDPFRRETENVMKEYVIEPLDPETWKGTFLPVSYTSNQYYDISVHRTEDGFDIPIRK